MEVSDESNRSELPRLSQDSQSWFPMPTLWEQEALDGQPSFLDDNPQWRLRVDLARSLALRVAGAPERTQGDGETVRSLGVEEVQVDERLAVLPVGVVERLATRTVVQEENPASVLGNTYGAGQVGPAPEDAVDGRSIAGGNSGFSVQVVAELWLMSHYTAGANWGNSTYPYGSPTASGLPVGPGMAACGVEYLGQMVRVGGWDFLCADTGSLVTSSVLDLWCEGESWGPTDPYFIVSESPVQYAKDQWWWGLPCPAPCEQEIDGRCYAKVRVME